MKRMKKISVAALTLLFVTTATLGQNPCKWCEGVRIVIENDSRLSKKQKADLLTILDAAEKLISKHPSDSAEVMWAFDLIYDWMLKEQGNPLGEILSEQDERIEKAFNDGLPPPRPDDRLDKVLLGDPPEEGCAVAIVVRKGASKFRTGRRYLTRAWQNVVMTAMFADLDPPLALPKGTCKWSVSPEDGVLLGRPEGSSDEDHIFQALTAATERGFKVKVTCVVEDLKCEDTITIVVIFP